MRRFNWMLLAISLLLVETGVSQRDYRDENADEEQWQEEEDMEGEEDELSLKGHMEPIGNSGWSWEVEETTELLDPITFYDRYVSKSKPLIFRGLAKKYPSYERLRDDAYLKQNYGKWKVYWELTKKEDRKREGAQGSYRKFLDTYKRKQTYMVSDVIHPNPFTKEVYIPKMLLCDGLLKHIETVIMWQSSGGTKSVLHHDTAENLNCVIDGVKHFTMAHQRQVDVIPLTPDGTHSPVDVDKVDIRQYPELSKVSWYKAHVRPGDCLYIPEKWLHQVDSRGGANSRSLAFNVWFSKTAELPSRQQCQSKLTELKDFESWANFKRSLDHIKRNTLVTSFGNEKEPFSIDRFHDVVHNTIGLELEQSKELFGRIDADDDGLVTFRDMYESELERWQPYIDRSGLIAPDLSSKSLYEEVQNAKDEL